MEGLGCRYLPDGCRSPMSTIAPPCHSRDCVQRVLPDTRVDILLINDEATVVASMWAVHRLGVRLLRASSRSEKQAVSDRNKGSIHGGASRDRTDDLIVANSASEADGKGLERPEVTS